jgi:hypothetical protein
MDRQKEKDIIRSNRWIDRKKSYKEERQIDRQRE